MISRRTIFSCFILMLLLPVVVFQGCYALMQPNSKNTLTFRHLSRTTRLHYESWGIADNWSNLSSEAEETSSSASMTATHEDQISDPVGVAVGMFEAAFEPRTDDSTRAHESFYDEVTKILVPHDDDTNGLGSIGQGSSDPDSTVEHEAEEIGLLIRCNQIPNKLLVDEGRGLQPLSDDEKYDVAQLLMIVPDTRPNQQKHLLVTTSFFNDSVFKIFQQHSSFDSSVGIRVLDRDGVAKWMTACLKDESVNKNDKRVLEVISRFSSYGTGYLKEKEFLQLYKDVLAVDVEDGKFKRPSTRRISSVQKIWRDFAAHGIPSPNEVEWQRKNNELRATLSPKLDNNHKPANSSKIQLLHDECEILEWNQDNTSPHWTVDSKGAKNLRRSSHQHVELCSDEQTPKRIRDGQFVFIDEESCIGCTQCVHAAPSSFMMLDTGRARAFRQSNTPDVKSAVSACPVDCMKFLSFRELRELETARDQGVTEGDSHKDVGHIPLYVAGIDSDAKHKSSWYHTLKHKCFTSSSCPQKGCYDCPMYSSPGENPYFKQGQVKALEVRKKDLFESDELNTFRKVVEL